MAKINQPEESSGSQRCDPGLPSAPRDGNLLAMAAEELSRAIIELLRREPFFGQVVGGLSRYFTEKIPTMAVGLRGNTVQLLVNPRFLLEGLPRAEDRVAVLKHEVLHVVFKHLFRVSGPLHDARIWNIAADLVVNQYVPPFQLPEGAILLSSFSDARLAPDQTVDGYYEALIALQESGNRYFGATPLGTAALRSMLSSTPQSDHSHWAMGSVGELDAEPTGAAVPKYLQELLSDAIDEQILRARDRTIASRGTMPDWMERIVGELAAHRKPRVNWRRTLRLFASSSQRTRMVMTTRRESKRYEGIAGLGRVAGLMAKRYQRIAVIIDTSGSVGQAQLQMFFAEIRGIYRQGTQIVVVECDSDVRRSYLYKGCTPEIVYGDGGTSFEPALRWLREQRGERFDACIFFTDGEGGAPETSPPCPLLWVIVNGAGGDHLRFGRQILLEGC
jgi:predicted metal-dependent peptidase